MFKPFNATLHRRAGKSLRSFILALMVPAVIAGCASSERLAAVPPAETAQADIGLGAIRFFVRRDLAAFEAEARASLDKELAYRASIGETGPLPPVYFLAVSGGGDNGAFGAGLLNGWTEAGTRPEFKAVTGVSTGALIAPFAFLGPKYDAVLKEVYTQVSKKDIFEERGMITGIMGDAMADTTPLYETIKRHTPQSLLDAIAVEYAKGRLLLVGTAALDSLEPVVWNMTAIAASKDPRAPELFRRILVASASIPGAFPPVMLDVSVGGVPHQEMHVDGGTIAQVFLYPPGFRLNQAGPTAGRERHLYIIRNARLDPDWASVERKTLPIAARAISSLTQTQGIGDLYRIFATATRDNIDYNLAFIPPSFNTPHREQFDTYYMQQLFALGRKMALDGYKWEKFPPGYNGD